jgi:hypothetical protein
MSRFLLASLPVLAGALSAPAQAQCGYQELLASDAAAGNGFGEDIAFSDGAGASSYPTGSELSIAVRGAVMSGDTRFY